MKLSVLTEPQSLTDLAQSACREFRDRPAFYAGNTEIRFGEFWEAVRHFAGALQQLGISKGDRIPIILPNMPEFAIAYFGGLLAGAEVVPTNIMLRSFELRYIFDDCEARLIVVWNKILEQVLAAFEGQDLPPICVVGETPEAFLSFETLLKKMAPYQPVDIFPDDPAVILYTSGTTGHPKGAVLSHWNLASNALACIRAGTVIPEDRVLGVLPFYHSFGQTVVLNTCLLSGAMNVMVPRFEPEEVIRTLEERDVTIFVAVPTMFKMLADFQQQPKRLPSVRTCISGGAKLDDYVVQDFERAFGLPIYEGYGLTEASPVVSFNPMDYRSKPGSVGLPVADVEIRIVDEHGKEVAHGKEGEIIVRGPNVMKGYLNRPEATKEAIRDGWLYTGDIGKLDHDGYLYILDRKKEIIIKGGFNVYPKEVENVLLLHPKVKEVAVIGVPDPIQGEEVKAFVVPKPGKRINRKELLEYCQEHLALYKCPKYITFLHELPRSSSGRILKRKLYRGRRRKK
jgi:long-chain acyl-CoA synthetase